MSCDWKLDSNKTEDLCGICGGDNSSCDIYSEIIEILANQEGGYQFILEIPLGSRSVTITKKTDTNYLALKNPENGLNFKKFKKFLMCKLMLDLNSR